MSEQFMAQRAPLLNWVPFVPRACAVDGHQSHYRGWFHGWTYRVGEDGPDLCAVIEVGGGEVRVQSLRLRTLSFEDRD